MGKYYFVSDVHLGLDYGDARKRERKFASFLQQLPFDTAGVFLLGDIFDFWYEYKYVIPRGFTRVLGALASLRDRNIPVWFFNGNHDVWTYSYLQEELDLKILHQPCVLELEGKRFCLGHGDGLGSGDFGYKFLRSIFHCRFLQILFSGIHPRWAFGLARTWSRHNRLTKGERFLFRGKEERIVRFAEAFQQNLPAGRKADYFIFGHFHYKARIPLDQGGELILLGEWIHHCDYLLFDGERLTEGIYGEG